MHDEPPDIILDGKPYWVRREPQKAILAPVVDDDPAGWPSDCQYVRELMAEGFEPHAIHVWWRVRQAYRPNALRFWLALRRN